MTKKEPNKTIFEMLFESKICFTVNVSIRTFKIKSIEENSRAYFIIVHQDDLNDITINGKISSHSKAIDKFIFNRTNEYSDVFERDLSGDDIIEFKKYMDKFTKVKHNKFGRIYELKGNSFKKLYESKKQKNKI